jgi:hypothetical protein
MGGGGLPVTMKARQSAQNNRQAMNAAMGLDNFARMLKSDPQKAVQLAQQQQGGGQGMMPGIPVQGGLPGQAQIRGQLQPQFQGQFQGQLQPQTVSMAELQRLGMTGNPGDMQAFRSMDLLQRVVQDSAAPLMAVNSLKSIASARLAGPDAAALSMRVNTHKAQIADKAESEGTQAVGTVSASFESGKDGVAAIGYDRAGGTSYGKYQIASKTGSMDGFMTFLQSDAPDLAKRLAAAGPANTGSKEGKMPQVWREIAAEQPSRFAALQQEFIHKSHFQPAMDRLGERTGLDEKELTPALAEMIFSTAVQHGAGGASRIIARALDAVGLDKLRSANNAEAKQAEQEVIRQVYNNRSGQFASSSGRVREAVQARLRNEMDVMLDMAKLA